MLMKNFLSPSSTKAALCLLVVLTGVTLLGPGFVRPRLWASTEATDAVLVGWQAPTHISQGSNNAAFPVLRRAPNGRIMIVYNNYEPGPPSIQNLLYRQSLDNGRSWQTALPVYDNSANSQHVSFAFGSNSVAHAVWVTSENQLHYAREDGWPTTARLIRATPGNIFSPQIVVTGANHIDIVWEESSPQNIYHARSVDGGVNWSAPTPLANGEQLPTSPTIGVDQNGHLHVLWVDIHILPLNASFLRYLRGVPGSAPLHTVSWAGPPQTISNAPGMGDAVDPFLFITGAAVHVAFANRVSPDEHYVYYTRRSDGIWSAPVNISGAQSLTINDRPPYSLNPTISVCDDTVYIYYQAAIPAASKEQIWGKKAKTAQAASSSAWSPQNRATNSDLNGDGEPDTRTLYPHLLCNSTSLHLAYHHVSGTGPTSNRQVFYIHALNTVYLPVVRK
jgi:hypothetical protein